jgi:hypothetical protein
VKRQAQGYPWLCGLEIIRERRKVDCHFRRFGRFSKQIFAGRLRALVPRR